MSKTSTDSMTPDEIEFTNAFNNQRMTLAGFSKCANREELHIVRDGFYLGLASDLKLEEYEPVRVRIITDSTVADACRTENAFRKTVEIARKSEAWPDLVISLIAKARSVGSNIEELWMTLERGRLEWLAAASAAHQVKTMLKTALDNTCGGATDADLNDAKMIWIYCLAAGIPSLAKSAEVWRSVVGMEDPLKPLVGYDPELWDPRKEEWRPIDLGVQDAAERGGSTIDEAWKL